MFVGTAQNDQISTKHHTQRINGQLVYLRRLAIWLCCDAPFFKVCRVKFRSDVTQWQDPQSSRRACLGTSTFVTWLPHRQYDENCGQRAAACHAEGPTRINHIDIIEEQGGAKRICLPTYPYYKFVAVGQKVDSVVDKCPAHTHSQNLGLPLYNRMLPQYRSRWIKE